MIQRLLGFAFACLVAASSLLAAPMQDRPLPAGGLDLRLQIVAGQQPHHALTAVAWVEALAGTPDPLPSPAHRYMLLQKNRVFTPHLLVIPVGTVVDFPNADPFFHNVFSLFDGKRFDLGLYEAGSNKSVTFSREGVSYIFCNIHPEMSAVVLVLSKPLYAIADARGAMTLHDLAPGDYRLHIWIEGMLQGDLDRLSRTIHLSHSLDLGPLTVPGAGAGPVNHTNKFGKPYSPPPGPEY